MKIDRNIVLAAVVAFAIAWFLAHASTGDIIPNPFVPQKPDRPVLKFIAKVAKTFLWVAVFAEPRPEPTHHHYVQASVGPDGHALIDHAESF